MISAIVGRFIFIIQSCHPCAASCGSCSAAALSTAPAVSATFLAPARFAFSPGTLRAGRSLSGDSEIGRDGFEIECFAYKVSQRDDKVVCRHMATLHQLLRRESRQTHLFLCPQKNGVRERRFIRVAHAPAPVRTGHDFDSRSNGQLTQFTEVSRVHREIACERASKRFVGGHEKAKSLVDLPVGPLAALLHRGHDQKANPHSHHRHQGHREEGGKKTSARAEIETSHAATVIEAGSI